MKFTACLLGSLLLAGAAVWADNDKEKLAEELLVASETPKMLDQMTGQIEQMQTQMLQKMNIPADKQAEAAAFQKQLIAKLTSEFSWQKMKGDFIKIYTDVYTEEELKGLLAFMKSPLGQKMIAKQPEMMQKALQLTQSKLLTLMPDLEKMEADFVAKMKAAAVAKAAAAKTAPTATPAPTGKK